MGLDMYAYSVSKQVAQNQQVDISIHSRAKRKDLAYWRKFSHLHGWMEDLYHNKEGQSDNFNGDNVRLMSEDLDRLDNIFQDLQINNLLQVNNPGFMPRQGFFWGSGELYPEDIESTKQFIIDARAEIKAGRAVIYDSSW